MFTLFVCCLVSVVFFLCTFSFDIFVTVDLVNVFLKPADNTYYTVHFLLALANLIWVCSLKTRGICVIRLFWSNLFLRRYSMFKKYHAPFPYSNYACCLVFMCDAFYLVFCYLGLCCFMCLLFISC